MWDKTYALFDLIGVASAIRDGTGAKLLEQFWQSVKVWTEHSFEPVHIQEMKGTCTPDVRVATFSDSLLLHTREELGIDDFYNIVYDLKHCIEREGICRSYVIVSRSLEINRSWISTIGANCIGSDGLPKYYHVAGSGEAWINLFLAEKKIKKKNEWHERYSIYCVGQKSLPQKGFQDLIECKGSCGTTVVYAIE